MIEIRLVLLSHFTVGKSKSHTWVGVPSEKLKEPCSGPPTPKARSFTHTPEHSGCGCPQSLSPSASKSVGFA